MRQPLLTAPTSRRWQIPFLVATMVMDWAMQGHVVSATQLLETVSGTGVLHLW